MNPIQPVYRHPIYHNVPIAPAQPVTAEQPPRKRTKKDRACDLCRRKKIRCDYDQANPQSSCTSCKSYEKQCTFNEAAKKRGPPKGYVEGLENRLKRMETLLVNIASSGNLPQDALKEVLNKDEEGSDTSSHFSERLSETTSPSTSYDPQSSPTVDKSERILPRPRGAKCLDALHDKNKQPLSYVGSSSGIYLLSKLLPKDGTNGLQATLPKGLDSDENDLLVARFDHDNDKKLGFCLSKQPEWELPCKEIQDYLINIYFTQMNNILPILDEEIFYKDYKNNANDPKLVPIIITICRITCRLLKDGDPLVKKYNLDRAKMFKDFAHQIETNFDMDFLNPNIGTIQVLLLNAANTEKWTVESSDWICTSVAVKMAQDLGLHRASSRHQDVPKKDREARKRLWWSAYVIDRWICASLGRPLTISDADCDVEYPDPEDTKYLYFIEMVKLSCILGDVLRSICSPRARVLSEKGMGLEKWSHNLEQLLLEWREALPADLKLTNDELDRVSRAQLDPALSQKINNGAGRLGIFYYGVLLLIKRPFMSTGVSQHSSDVVMPPECQTAVRMTVNLFDAIVPVGLLSGWSLSAYCIAQTQMVLFLNYRNASASLSEESMSLSERFKRYIHELSNYITERSLVPFLELLSKIISGKTTLDKQLQANIASDHDNGSSIADKQTVLWGASDGIDWQEMVKLLAETGYQV